MKNGLKMTMVILGVTVGSVIGVSSVEAGQMSKVACRKINSGVRVGTAISTQSLPQDKNQVLDADKKI